MTSSVLFTPVGINRMTLKNRIVMPAMASYHAAVNGEATEKLIRYHEERAKGGVGMNIVEATYVARSGNSFDLGLGISDDFMIKGLSKLTDAVHRHDGKIAIQLQHGGRFGNPPTSGCPRLLVSMIPGLAPTENARVMDADDIEGMVEAYVQAARRAVEAGFDAVEIHGAHGYLINQFMSPLTNLREDAYGGSFENRMRVPLEVLRAVRKQVGPDFPILFRYSMEEFMPGGIDMEQAVRIAKVMADNGVDMLNVSIGIGESVEYIIPPASVPDGWNADRAAAIKRAVGSRIPVAVVGRICNRKTAENIIASGKADLVAMGRALLADPFLPAKLAEGRDDEILTCIGCNEGCTGMLNECRPISCALNPRTGYEDDYPMTQADAPKAVVVIGGGPAGCEAALTAAQRGHKVVLFEATSTLGGLANIAALPPGKGVFATLGTYFSTMLPRAGVDVRLNTKADADAVRALHPDHVIVATGGTPIVPRFCADSPVVLAQDILTGAAQAGSRVLVIGGGLVGSETAEFLADKGREVTVVELRDGIALDMEYKTRQMLMPKLAALGVVCLTETEVLEIGCNGNVKVKTPYLEKELSGFDTVVVALGYRPDAALCADLAAADIDFVQVGDCKKVGKIINGVWEAFQLAYRI